LLFHQGLIRSGLIVCPKPLVHNWCRELKLWAPDLPYEVFPSEAELRRRIVTDPHSPGQFRAIGPHVNMKEFYDAFGIHEGDPMWVTPEKRAKVW
jgi:SNF2 family DNA or RNA helicase